MKEFPLEFTFHGKNKIPYLSIKGMEIGTCIVCLKKLDTVSHHIIPVRMRIKHNSKLSKLRIRVCSECHSLIHDENSKIDGIELIKRKEDQIRKLQKELASMKENSFDWLLKKLENDRNSYINDIRKFTIELKKENNLKAIFPMQKQLEGRIKEIENIEKTIKLNIKFNRR